MKAFLTEWLNRTEMPQTEVAESSPRPDKTWPDEIYIPADCPNDIESLRVCIDAQSLRREIE